MGKAIFFKANLSDNYTKESISLALFEEARAKARWLEEFKEIYPLSKIVILFGSILRNPEKAKDIDLLVIVEEKNMKAVEKVIEKKNEVMLKKVHLSEQRMSDLKENIKKNNPALLDAIKTGIILHGRDELVEVVSDVANRQ